MVEYRSGRIIETDQTLYEAMGFKKSEPVIPSNPTKPAQPTVKDNQIFGIVEFAKTYTYGENHEYTGYELRFYDNDKSYKTGSTKIVADGKLNGNKVTEATEIEFHDGDYVWLEEIYNGSNVYKIVQVIQATAFVPGIEDPDNYHPLPIVVDDDDIVTPPIMPSFPIVP